MVKGTKSDKVREVLCKISDKKRDKVKEVTLDIAATMDKIVKRYFPKVILVTDRFHVQNLPMMPFRI